MAQVQIVELGLACCGLEFHSSQLRADVQDAAEAVRAMDVDVLVLAGTMTHALRDVVVASYEQLGPRRAVIGFGACTISGGPYWDSYSVMNQSPVPIDVMVPGCPPAPAALAAGFRELQSVLTTRAHT